MSIMFLYITYIICGIFKIIFVCTLSVLNNSRYIMHTRALVEENENNNITKEPNTQ